MTKASATKIPKLSPSQVYCMSMENVRARFRTIESILRIENGYIRMEHLGLQNRKIVEAVAYAALSACEEANKNTLREQRTKDADKLLSWLHSKKLLRLPQAQTCRIPEDSSYKAIFLGAGERDLSVQQLLAIYGRASGAIHHRHPERLTNAQIASEVGPLEEDSKALRSWLWLHITDLPDIAILIQMGQTDSFYSTMARPPSARL